MTIKLNQTEAVSMATAIKAGETTAEILYPLSKLG